MPKNTGRDPESAGREPDLLTLREQVRVTKHQHEIIHGVRLCLCVCSECLDENGLCRCTYCGCGGPK